MDSLIPVLNLLAIVWMHFVADFLLQSDRMALNKSKSNTWLAAHCSVYGACMLWVFAGWRFALVAGILHFAVDWATSRGTSLLWARNERHWFFALIGLDQAIHMTLLLVCWICLATQN